jgi:hypothetical protein
MARLTITKAQAKRLGLSPVKSRTAHGAKTSANMSKGKLVADGIKAWCRATGLPEPVTEHYFAKPRMWRFDLAWPSMMLALEIQGGEWHKGGAHGFGKGLQDDCERQCEAVIRGWWVMTVTHSQVKNGQAHAWIERAIRAQTLAPAIP